ncbi:hypothetical protein GOBAR_AA12966 [Gossypium barbadense]|uniref:Uncharacterized protein n=1 Tax=Gossypium barbadense TaxID=3634 RepID=A0A2P5XWF4_GOSBA|nr:hypothetical protein GOBAR_AA12966 [Gossypium barbadense]
MVGVKEPYTKVGGESNVGLELGESSDACAESEESSESSGTSDTNNSLGSEGVLGAKPEDEEVRNIKAWYRNYKGKKKNQKK